MLIRALTFLVALAPLSAAQSSLQVDLDGRAGDIAGSGRFVAGAGSSGGAALWSLGSGWSDIGGARAGRFVSDGGDVVVAGSPASGGEVWERGSGWRPIGTLGGGPVALSTGGSTVLMQVDGAARSTYAWDRSSSVEWALPLPAGAAGTVGRALSADGQVIVGRADFPGVGSVGVVWDRIAGTVDLVSPPAQGLVEIAVGVSPNGEWVVGERTVAGVTTAFRWNRSTGRLDLPGIGAPSGSVDHIGRFVSDDGERVFGRRWDFTSFDFRAFVWTATGGTVFVSDWIAASGGDSPGAFDAIESVAEDGRRFVLRPGAAGGQLFYDLDARVSLSFCAPAIPNSTGSPARLLALGSSLVADRTLFLRAFDMPLQQPALAVCSLDRDLVPAVGGSAGTLCLGGAIGRFPLRSTGADGRLEVRVDIGALPTPSGPGPALAGATWSFQVWYGDPGGGGSNLTDGAAVLFE